MDIKNIPPLKETYSMISTIMLSIVQSLADDSLLDRLAKEKEVAVRKTFCQYSTVKVFAHVINKMDSRSRKVFRPELITAMHMFAYARDIILLITDNDEEINKAVYEIAKENGLSLDECEIVHAAVNTIRKQLADVISGELRCLLCSSTSIRFNQHDFDKCCVDKTFNETNYKPTLHWLVLGFNSPYMS